MPTLGRSTAGGASGPTRSAIVGGLVTGHHLLDIDGYSQTKEKLPTGQFIKSRPFTVGGRSWRIKYYPNGDSRPESTDFISIYLLLDESVSVAVKARVKFSLLDQSGVPVPSHSLTTMVKDFSVSGFGYGTFIKREFLEKSGHLKDDCFTIKCDVIVFEDLRTEDRAAPSPFVAVPPADLNRHLGGLLAAKAGADVTFQVGGETFSAHRCVLAARSPVFKAELFGTMKESDATAVIRVDDMEAEVFRALLGFVYTDTLQDMNDQEEAAMAQHLLVAADRYNLERLKLICEDKLCKHVGTSSVATILALAEQHHCCGLKEACFAFICSSTTHNHSKVVPS